MMKRLFLKSNLMLVAIISLVTACEQDIIMFDSSMNLVGFTASETAINESLGEPYPVSVYFGASLGTPATTVTLSVDTIGFGTSGAVEGKDFTISSKSVSVEAGGEASVNISPINNNIFTGNKKFHLVISSTSDNSRISAQKSYVVTIADDEHPLKQWIGTYTVRAVSYGNPGGWDEAWTVLTSAVEGKLNQLAITGLGDGSTEPLIATIDKEALTISIEGAQDLGAAYGQDNGAVKLYYGTAELLAQVYAGEEVTSTMLSTASRIKITGTLEADGTIHLDKMAMILTEYDWCWDVFDTTWTKQ